jgi:hypothetical protein
MLPSLLFMIPIKGKKNEEANGISFEIVIKQQQHE